MQILGIESSSLVASVALYDGKNVIAEYTVNYQKTHSQTLLPMLDEIVRMTGFDLKSIDAIALSNGPGSFTGLRIGSATAKGLGQALEKPIIEVPTVTAMGFLCYGFGGYICPIMDARRSQVYTGLYRFTPDVSTPEDEDHIIKEGMMFETLMKPCAMSVEDLMGRLNELDAPVLLLGDGVPVYRTTMSEMANELPDHKQRLFFAPEYLGRQRAGAVACLGEKYREKGYFTVSADASGPDYLRKSQAEREMEEKAGTC